MTADETYIGRKQRILDQAADTGNVAKACNESNRRITANPGKYRTLAPNADEPRNVGELLFTIGGTDYGDKIVEITHEALLSNWPRGANWIEQNLDYLRTER